MGWSDGFSEPPTKIYRSSIFTVPIWALFFVQNQKQAAIVRVHRI
jgi:hypothetical protein